MADGKIIGFLVSNRYELTERLGETALFSTYKATDHRQNRAVTVKVLKAGRELQDLELWRKALAGVFSLTYQGVVKLYEVCRFGDRVCFIMEHVRGIDLKERIKRTSPLSVAAAIDLAVSIAEALEQAHKQGIAHGDLRPANVVVDSEGRAKVSGFGMAAVLAKADGEMDLDAALYAAPEMLQGQPPTPASDIYSLGVILYEMLTGSVPLDGETSVAVALRRSAEEPVPPGRVRRGIPKAIEGIVLKCLQKSPDKRYRSVSSLLADLRLVQDALRFGRSLEWTPADIRHPDEDEQEVEEGPKGFPVLSALSKVAMLVIGVALLALTITFWAVFLRGTSDTRVPRVIGLSREDAERIIVKAGLTPHIVEEWSDVVPEGKVTRTYPKGNAPVKQGRDVTVWVSKGPQKVLVPDVAQRMDEASARRAIEESGLSVGSIERMYSDTVPRGFVISQEPQGGTMASRGDRVVLVVSEGPSEVTVPSLAYEQTEQNAIRMLKEVGLQVGEITREYSDLVQAGYVIQQDPPPGSRVQVGTAVSLVISRGREPLLGGGEYDEGADSEPPRRFRVAVTVPGGPDPQRVQIRVADIEGEKIVFDEMRSPGDSFVRIVPGRGDVVLVEVLTDGRVFYQRTFPKKGRR
ncbi:MAG: PASTA domain-containing protein [Armatimonadota bacterium]